MRHGEAGPSDGHRGSPRQERGLISATFVGGFPSPEFRLRPVLPEVAVVGRSNVGKSSLINALLGRRRLARTSRTPGTTQTINVFLVDQRYYMVDLPGYGYARRSKTARRRFATLLGGYLSERRTLAGAMWLIDVRREPTQDDLAVADILASRAVPLLVAITKGDKLGRGRRIQRARAIAAALGLTEDQCVVTSARTGDGIAELRSAIDLLVSQQRAKRP